MIKMRFNPGFFDNPKVIAAVGKARAKVLKAFGLKVRKFAQGSLRYMDKPVAGPRKRTASGKLLPRAVTRSTSRPGQPPFVHRTGFRKRTSKSTGRTRVHRVSPLRDRLLSDFDLASKSVVIGPMRLNNTLDSSALPALEHGGSSTSQNVRWVSGPKYGGAPKIITTKKRINVRARPFMNPALKAELPGLQPMWKNSVR